VFTQLLAKSPAKRAGERLYLDAARQGRAKALYADMGAPDTVDGRFELLTLHVILLVDRLKDAAPPAADVRQSLFDAYVSNLDGALREMGVGDLAVGKRMKKLGEVFYGRARAYEAAFLALPDGTGLRDILTRTVFQGSAADPALLMDYVLACREALRACALSAILSDGPTWSVS
jgi:cytochrome b pre-mRNA-processing protein 3